MKKQMSATVAAVFLLVALQSPVEAGSYMNQGRRMSLPAITADLMLLRPFGLAMTVAGAGLMLGLSPFVGIANIAPPHDAFLRTGNAMVVAPAGFTFNRPLGEFSYQPSGQYPVAVPSADTPFPATAPRGITGSHISRPIVRAPATR
ncbi:MAG: hypothetical protein ACK443_09935 [Methylococcaceae bacterium]|jgi:hypothetical protein